MASLLVIPLVIVAIVGLSGYFIYRFLIFDWMCKRAVNRALLKYNIQKTPSQIIKEFYQNKGEKISHKEIETLEKNYRQNGPDEFLTMYDAIRDRKHKEE